MRLCRFDDNRVGIVDGSHVRDVTLALDVLPDFRYPLPRHDVLVANLDAIAERAKAIAADSPPVSISGVKLLSPVANPGKIVAAPVNYQKHVDEARGDPGTFSERHLVEIQRIGVFLKAASSVVGPGEGVVICKPDRRNDHEVELAVVIGKAASRVNRADALKHVAGYCIGLDITVRGPEERSLRKSPDSYTVLGPWLVTSDEIPRPGELDLTLALNGETRQQANTRDLILTVPELIELASSFYTLHPGDVLITGTPEGVSPIKPGDVMVATIEKIGTMEVAVRA